MPLNYFQSTQNTAGASCDTTGGSAIRPLVTPTMTPSSVPTTPVTGSSVFTVSFANLEVVLNRLTFEGGHPLKKMLCRHSLATTASGFMRFLGLLGPSVVPEGPLGPGSRFWPILT